MAAAGLAEVAGYGDHPGAVDIRARVLGTAISALTRFGLLPYAI